MPPAIFVDKDGTLIVDVPYNADPAKIVLYEDVGPALKRLHDAGYLIVVVTNQSGVAHGYFAEHQLAAVEHEIAQRLSRFGVPLAGFYYCPHHPAARLARYRALCDCRKPRAGLIETAAAELGISLEASWLIGDTLNDVEAGHRAAARAILIDNGGETEWEGGEHRRPDFTVKRFRDAADIILRQRAGSVGVMPREMAASAQDHPTCACTAAPSEV